MTGDEWYFAICGGLVGVALGIFLGLWARKRETVADILEFPRCEHGCPPCRSCRAYFAMRGDSL